MVGAHQAVRVVRDNASVSTLIATSRPGLIARARIGLPYSVFADLGGDFADAEARARSEG